MNNKIKKRKVRRPTTFDYDKIKADVPKYKPEDYLLKETYTASLTDFRSFDEKSLEDLRQQLRQYERTKYRKN